MKLSKIISSGIAAVALTAIGVHAQTINPAAGFDGSPNFDSGWAQGDLMLGFFSSSGANDVVFDIGSLSSYQNATAGTTYTVTGFDTPTDVTGSTATNGSAGNPDGGVGAFGASTFWAVGGGNHNSGEFTVAVAAGNNLTNSAGYSLAPTLDSLGAELSGSVGSGNSAYDTILSDKPVSNHLSLITNTWTGGPSVTSDSVTTGTTSLVLWDVNKGSTTGAAIDLGTFTLNTSTDVLTFTAFSAIPEPSTYAAILGVLTIGFVIVRRRFGSSGLSATV
jgi:hypothetical protein